MQGENEASVSLLYGSAKPDYIAFQYQCVMSAFTPCINMKYSFLPTTLDTDHDLMWGVKGAYELKDAKTLFLWIQCKFYIFPSVINCELVLYKKYVSQLVCIAWSL